LQSGKNGKHNWAWSFLFKNAEAVFLVMCDTPMNKLWVT